MVEGDAPDILRDVIAECNQRAREAVIEYANRNINRKKIFRAKTKDYKYDTYGYIISVTRADQTAISFLETEFEKKAGKGDSEISYCFHGKTYDTKSGKEIELTELIENDEICATMLQEALSVKYQVENIASTGTSDYAWTADSLGVRFYFNSDAVSTEKRREIEDYSARAITVGFSYDDLSGSMAKALSNVQGAYIAMIDRNTVYTLPHGNLSVMLTEKNDSLVIQIDRPHKDTDELIIEYADAQSDFYIIRAKDDFYLFRERVGYQEGFFYDFSRPDGGFGRFAYHTAQYFDSFLREIDLAIPYNPYYVHMAEIRRSFGEKSYDAASFIPHGYYTFPSDPDARYKRFLLLDSNLQIDSYNVVCHLLESFTATQIDSEGNEIGEFVVPAGENLIFESVTGEAARYNNSPYSSQFSPCFYDCRLTNGTRIRFESDTESTVSVATKGYVNRFARPISLGEALIETTLEETEIFTVRIGSKDYPLIPDYSRKTHMGEEIDFGQDVWWQVEGYPGRYK